MSSERNIFTNIYSNPRNISEMHQFLKNTVTAEDIRNYFNKYQNNDSTEDLIGLFSKISDIKISKIKEIIPDIANYIDIIIFLLYSETITIEQAKSLIGNISAETKVIDILLAIELGLIKFDFGTIPEFKHKLAVDSIPKIFYGRKDILSYKDMNNINSEIQKIFKENGFNESDNFYLKIYSELNDKNSNCGSWFCSINNNKAIIYDYLPLVTLAINNIPYFNTSDVEKSYLSDLDISSNVNAISEVITKYYYHDYTDNDREKLKTLLEKIMQRTINYNET